jgi:hypothetical protein
MRGNRRKNLAFMALLAMLTASPALAEDAPLSILPSQLQAVPVSPQNPSKSVTVPIEAQKPPAPEPATPATGAPQPAAPVVPPASVEAQKTVTPEPPPVATPVQAVSAPNAGSARASVALRVGQHEGYDRIVFDWPRGVGYRVTREGGHVSIYFNASGAVNLTPSAKLTRGRKFSSSTDADGHLIVSFDIDAKATLKDFFSGPSIAVDISGASLAETPAAPVAASVKAKAKPKLEAATAAPVTAAPALSVGTSKPQSAAPVAPASSPPAAAPEPAAQAPSVVASAPAAQAVKLAAPIITPPSLIVGTSKPQAVAPVTPPAAQAVVATAAPAAAPPSPAPATAAVAAPVKPVKVVPSLNIGTTPLLIVSLDPHTPLRAAIWARGGSGYIVFDRKLTLSAEALGAGLPAPLVALQELDVAKASGFRFPIPDNVEIHAMRDGTQWKIYLNRQQPDVPVSSTLVAQPDFALGARFLLPLPDVPEPVRMTDPVVGDDLIVIPLNQTQAFSVMRRMADFQIWPAAQGMVIKPIRDKLLVRSVSDGIEITVDSGLHMSPASDTGASQQSPQKARSAAAGKSLFDFASWRGKSEETFTKTRQRLQQTIVDVPDRERNRARLELARFYFARGYGEEALALLNLLGKEVPDLAAHADFLAFMGATEILANHPDAGLKDLAASNIVDQPEIKLWQAVGNAKIRNWTEAEDKFVSSEALLAGYPEPFFSRFFVLAIESALAVGNNREAADWLEQLQGAQHSDTIDPAIQYLQGVLHAKSGRAQAASMAWKLVAASNDRLYKVRAELALIDLGVANLSISAAQAADRLEALRFAWRGDDLEVDILHRLGQYYVKAKNVKAGLNVLSQATKLYPNSPMTPKIQIEMSKLFRDVFLGELGRNLSPLEALTLYQQYREILMPTGEDGVAVTRNLAERLAAIDLMNQAGDLLEDIVKTKLKGEEKGRVAARLSAIRLLDHKPQEALDALDLSAGDFLSVNLQRERVLLRAKALAEMQREDEALAVLKDDTRFPAKLLRADINMKAQRWEEAAKALLDLIGPPPRPGENLRDDQADWLVRCAVAMALTSDKVGLDRLAIDYGAAMAGTSQNNTFRVLVQPEKPGQLRDITAAQGRISEVDMFQSFLDTYRKTDDPGDGPVGKAR